MPPIAVSWISTPYATFLSIGNQSGEYLKLAGTSKVLIIGATGHFGARISRRLAKDPSIDLLISSRDKRKADELAQDIQSACPNATVSGIALDQSSTDFNSNIEELSPFAVIHTAGPYQQQDYRVAEACITVKSHYIDLADGRHFVNNFKSLSDPAQRAGVLLISGASTLPGISTAVINDLKAELNHIDRVEISIAPAHQTPRGPGTVAAVLSYCGRPFQTLRDGKWKTIYGWHDMRLQKYPALGYRLAAACDVPDLSLLTEYLPSVRSVSFHAALEAPWEQLSLWVMAWLTRFHVVSDWSKYVSFFAALSDRSISLGSVKGGMYIRMFGESGDGQPATYTWFLTADDNHGPEIPCTPSIVLVKKLLRGELSDRGAYACHGFFTIDEIMDELAEFTISCEITKEPES